MGTGNPIVEKTLESWAEFAEEASKVSETGRYIWRGQEIDWPLQSSFDRKQKLGKGRQEALARHLKRFKEVMERLYPGVLPRIENSVWAMGQHYGIDTPLLDWTRSPYIAAYFAFEKKPGRSIRTYRYVYALERTVRRLTRKRLKGDGKISRVRYVDIIEELGYPSPRFWAQESLFTRSMDGCDVETDVRCFADRRPGDRYLVKFRIPTKDRDECLYNLSLMGVNALRLMIDLKDAVSACQETKNRRRRG
jgi:hypothetical protein